MRIRGVVLTRTDGVKVINKFFPSFVFGLITKLFLVKNKSKKKIKKKKVKELGKKKADSFSDDEAIEETPIPAISVQRPMSVDKKEDSFNRPPPKEALDMATSIKERLLAQIEQLGASLPPNTLDQLIDELGGPENVAEMTGRKGRVVQNDNGQVGSAFKSSHFFTHLTFDS